MDYNEAFALATKVKELLSPFCERIEIAGSIRRKKAKDIKDIEIVAIPKPYEVGLFESGIATVLNRWPAVKGTLPCKYTQRILPEGVKLDVFFAERINWGYIFAIRTGPADYSHKVLAAGWVKKGYKGENGYLTGSDGTVYPVQEEKDLFNRIGITYKAPELRGL